MLARIVRTLRVICQLAGFVLLAAGSSLLLVDWQAARAYRTVGAALGPRPLEESVGDTTRTGADAAQAAAVPTSRTQPDWHELIAINPDVCGWVRVDGTDIDLPVLAATSVPDGHYLSHDLWGRPSRTGVPFLDARCDPSGCHCLIYAHHLATGGQFSALQKAHRQEVFDTVDTCWWYLPTDEVTAFEPLCALVVDQWYAPIQHFAFADDTELRAWLTGLVAQADATTPTASSRIATATRVMTLVTCASELSGQPWRTLVVFAA